MAKDVITLLQEKDRRIAELEAEKAKLEKKLDLALLDHSAYELRITELVELLEKSHAECNDLSNEKLEILDRLVRLESENATLKAASQKHSDLWFGARIKSSIFKK